MKINAGRMVAEAGDILRINYNELIINKINKDENHRL